MCLFCKIANHDIDSYIVYEDTYYIAFLDINPVSLGHTLIMPKTHYDDFTECPSQVVKEMHEIALKLIEHYGDCIKPLGYNFLSNAKAVSGQSINHLHFHLIPRYGDSDGYDLHFHKIESAIPNSTLCQSLRVL
ncbi:MAG: HIT domain-containing protein [Erysipelotrichaceae bacterium]